MARILLGITGGIAAYKACELVRLFVRAGHEVLPLPTPGVERFVAPETFYALARTSPPGDPYPHLERADALVIAPLTANTLAKLAHGLADNILTEAALAHRGPLVLAPAMNTRMWTHSATQANVDILRSRGAIVVGPDEGELAEGEVGAGRMAEPSEIAQVVADGARERLSSGRSEQRACREARARDRRWDTRAPRRRSFPREPLLGTDGCCPGCGGVPPWRRRDASGREPRRLRAAGGRARRDAHRRRRGARDKHPRRLGRRRRHGRRCRGLPSRRSAERQAAEGRGAVDGGARADGRRARRTRRARAERTAARGLRGGGGPRPVSSGSGRCSTARTSISSSTTT